MIYGCKAMLTCGKKKVAIVGFQGIVTVCYESYDDQDPYCFLLSKVAES